MELDRFKNIKAFLTKQGLNILFTLLNLGPLCSGDIADVLHVSKSSASNALERIKMCEYPLIQVEIQGRRKIYSLTETAKKYLTQLMQEAGTAHNLEPAEQVRTCLGELQKERSDWNYFLCDYLKDADTEINEFMSQLINDYLDALWNVWKKNRLLAEEICQETNDPRCLEALKAYLAIRNCFYHLEKILSDNWLEAYKLIDRLFSGHSLLQQATLFDAAEDYGLSRQDYQDMILQLMKLINDAAANAINKTAFFTMIQKYRMEDPQITYYIAEKYDNYRRH